MEGQGNAPHTHKSKNQSFGERSHSSFAQCEEWGEISPAHLLPWVVPSSSLRAAGNLLEIGCGTSTLSTELAKAVGDSCHITATDCSEGAVRKCEEALRRAREALREEEKDPCALDNLSYGVMDILNIDSCERFLGGGGFDVVVSSD